jgi:hypothetical protein
MENRQENGIAHPRLPVPYSTWYVLVGLLSIYRYSLLKHSHLSFHIRPHLGTSVGSHMADKKMKKREKL